MASQTLQKFPKIARLLSFAGLTNFSQRHIVTKQSGAFYSEPKKVPLGVVRLIITVIPGLLIGASISKTMANFLEENDLFVPSDDDDDDD